MISKFHSWLKRHPVVHDVFDTLLGAFCLTFLVFNVSRMVATTSVLTLVAHGVGAYVMWTAMLDVRRATLERRRKLWDAAAARATAATVTTNPSDH
jgi:hypothetical protein